MFVARFTARLDAPAVRATGTLVDACLSELVETVSPCVKATLGGGFAPGRGGRLIAVVHTMRETTVRIISARRANRRERRRYVATTGTPAR